MTFHSIKRGLVFIVEQGTYMSVLSSALFLGTFIFISEQLPKYSPSNRQTSEEKTLTVLGNEDVSC